jgi:hypothetical protein
MNRRAIDLLQRAGVPEGVYFHDWWFYLVVSAFGTVVYDDEPSLLYRQHGGNVIGRGAGWFGRQRAVVRFLMNNDWVGILQRQVCAFLRCYGDSLPAHVRSWMLRYFDPFERGAAPRWRLVFSLRRWRQALVGDVALRILLLAYKARAWPLPHRWIKGARL